MDVVLLLLFFSLSVIHRLWMAVGRYVGRLVVASMWYVHRIRFPFFRLAAPRSSFLLMFSTFILGTTSSRLVFPNRFRCWSFVVFAVPFASIHFYEWLDSSHSHHHCVLACVPLCATIATAFSPNILCFSTVNIVYTRRILFVPLYAQRTRNNNNNRDGRKWTRETRTIVHYSLEK